MHAKARSHHASSKPTWHRDGAGPEAAAARPVSVALALGTGSRAAPGATTHDPCNQPHQGCLQPASDSAQPLAMYRAPLLREDDRRGLLSMPQVTSSFTCPTDGCVANDWSWLPKMVGIPGRLWVRRGGCGAQSASKSCLPRHTGVIARCGTRASTTGRLAGYVTVSD